MPEEKIETWEKYIAASTYMLDIGYLVYSLFFKHKKSKFVEYHNIHSRRLIKYTLFPAALFIFVLKNIFLGDILHYIGLIFVVSYFILIILGVKNSLKGVKKIL